MRTICIVGNIASGKTTLTSLLGSAIPNSIAIPEIFEENPFLPLYVQDPLRWAFMNAVRYMYDYARVFQELTAGHESARAFIDAGVATNRCVYGRYLLGEGLMTPNEHDLYVILADLIEKQFAYPKPDAFIFVHASPETCFRRMHERKWEYQTQNISLEYLIGLRKYFRAFEESVKGKQIPVLDLDSEKIDFKSDEGRREAIVRVREFFES